MSKKNTAQPGDWIELADKDGGFTDAETGFDISRSQQVQLGDSVGTRTQQAVISGGLLIVDGKPDPKRAVDKDALAQLKKQPAETDAEGK